MTDTKAIEPCTRRVIRPTGMICKPPRRGDMSSREHIAAHRAHKLNINLTDCENCPMRSQNVPVRPKIIHPRQLTVKDQPEEHIPGLAKAPSQTPQEARTEPPEITPLGSLVYPRTGWEPPPCPPGYQRKSDDPKSDDAWVLEPMGTACKHLQISFGEVGACGYPRVRRTCGKIQSFIGPTTCNNCRLREEQDDTG